MSVLVWNNAYLLRIRRMKRNKLFIKDMSYDEMETIRSSMYSAASTIDSHWTTGTMPIHYGGRHMTPIAPHLLRSSLPDMSKPPKVKAFSFHLFESSLWFVYFFKILNDWF